MLQASDDALWDAYDVAMLDLDGVVYVGAEAVPGAPEHLARARKAGMRLAYVTNNASRPPDAVATHLRELGIEVADDDVVTSAQAAARLLAEQLPAGSPVFVIGGRGLEVALTERGLRPVQDVDEDPVAVVSGFSADLRWGLVSAGAILVRQGLPWVASNTDRTVPTALGPGPGNGMLVGVVAQFAEREPVVAGKPQSPLFEETLLRVGGQRPLVVGDRLDTDIEGARAVGYDSLLVMTGVTDVATLVAAPPDLRPSYVAQDLGALARPQPAVSVEAGRCRSAGSTAAIENGRGNSGGNAASNSGGNPGARAEGWTAEVKDGRLDVSGSGGLDDWWRVVAVAGWSHLDATGDAPDVTDMHPPNDEAPHPVP